MLIKERQLRIYGSLVVALIFYIFFMLEMFFSWRDDMLWLKTPVIAILYTIAIWEPTRFIILLKRRKYRGLKNLKRRMALTVLMVAPYAGLVGYARVYVEDYINLWGVPVGNITYYSYNIGISLLFALLQVAAYESIYFFTEWNKSKTEAEELKKLNFQMQFDSLKVQIQPHFLFNTLNTLIGLMKIDTPRAIQFTEEMAHVYRYLLEANDRQLISLDEEMKFTKAYFFLLKTRYSEGLHLDIDDENNMASYQLPPLSLQVLLENAVKHNIITRDKPLYIKIEFHPALKQVIVSNNLQRKPQAFNSGLGLIHLKKKFDLLNMSGVSIAEKDHAFSVTVPIIKLNEYASSNY